MLALIFAKSIKDILNSITDESLSGFMRNKQCKILDLLDYNELIKDDSFFLLFLDFYEAFYSFEHALFYKLSLHLV